MKFKFACPKCQKSITATSEVVGKVAQCPSCGAKLRVPTPQPAAAAAAAPAPTQSPAGGGLPFDDDDWEEALNPFQSPEAEDETNLHDYDDKKLDRKSMRWARYGLKLVAAGLNGIAICVLLFLINFVALMLGAGPIAGVIAIVLLIGYAICGLLLFIGPYFCVFVPEKTGARQAALVSAAAQTVGFGLGFATLFANPDDPTEILGLSLLSLVAGATSYFGFLAFLSKVAEFVNCRDVVDKVASVKTLGGIIIGCYVLLIGLSAADKALEDYAMIAGIVVTIVSLTILISGLIAIVQYVGAVSRLSKAV